MAALTAALTLAVRIPVPQTGGYLNLGDAGVMLAGLLFGPLVGGLAGGIGSAAADLIGYPFYAPITLVVKGLEGALAGLGGPGRGPAARAAALAAAGAEMVAGYLLAELAMVGWGALAEVPGNVGQALGGALIAWPLAEALERSGAVGG